METIYCSNCKGKVTIHADYSFACSCEGPIDIQDGGDPLPESWRGHQMDADETLLNLRYAAHLEELYS